MNFWSIFAILLFGITVFVMGKIKVFDGIDPGSCDKSNKGEAILIRDRQDNPKLLTCLKISGAFQWRTVYGSIPPGEFLNPGCDCSDILNKDPKATDGFYWIKLKDKVPKKVWCDMSTDGGGFMLIGRKTSAVTWTVPSNNYPVGPFGPPHWSSDLGDAPILDFRVQMATSEEFEKTKAHWYYRLRAKRKLKKLMVINDGDCGRTSAGIGNIAFVKDLRTGQIVTTNFRCSKFGIVHHPLTKFGWSMMNSCLQKACRRGFAFHHKFPIQTDYSGAFSYSVSGKISGIDHLATAFIGCDNGKCCGCYGPVGGKKNYCSKECKPKNGGTISTKVFTWFWVRSSLPKRLWRKCMEYNVSKNGKVMWYKLVGDKEIPVQGRCEKNKALFYDGMVVVSDNETSKTIPSIAGLMVYRKDNERLYITGKKTWNEIAQERKVLEKTSTMFQPKLHELDKRMENQNQTLTTMVNKDIAQLERQIQYINRTLQDELSRLLDNDATNQKKLNNLTLEITQTNKNIEKKLEKLLQLGKFGNPGKSCLDILQNTRGKSLSSGEYWILIDNKIPMKVYCDMKTDGGGWTLVSNIVLQDSSGFSWSLSTDFRDISDYKSKKLGLSAYTLKALSMKMPFTQLRFYCHKKIPGRTFHIVTQKNMMGRNVVLFFTAQTNSFPKACGSFYRLSDDTSILARECSNWGRESGKYNVGKWWHDSIPVKDRLFNHMAFIKAKAHWIIPYSAGGRWECDDYSSTSGFARSAGDFWRIFVR